MPDWCPKCNAMLPPGLEECPRCGKKLSGTGEKPRALENQDIANITLVVLGFAAIPIVVIILIAVVCVMTGR